MAINMLIYLPELTTNPGITKTYNRVKYWVVSAQFLSPLYGIQYWLQQPTLTLASIKYGVHLIWPHSNSLMYSVLLLLVIGFQFLSFLSICQVECFYILFIIWCFLIILIFQYFHLGYCFFSLIFWDITD